MQFQPCSENAGKAHDSSTRLRLTGTSLSVGGAMILVACSKSALMDHLKTREISEFENTQNIRSLEDGRVALWPFSVATSLVHDM